jgi:hypothetical protein
MDDQKLIERANRGEGKALTEILTRRPHLIPRSRGAMAMYQAMSRKRKEQHGRR